MKIYTLCMMLVVSLGGCRQAGSDTSSSALDTKVYASATPPVEQKSNTTVPIIELNIGGLLGGVKNGQWMAAKDVAGNLQAGDEYQIYNSENAVKSSAKANSPEVGSPCEEFYGINFSSETKKNGVAFGAGLSWNPMPRPVRNLDVNSPVYRKIVAETLAGKGLSGKDVKITQIFQTDLDGDGTDEVVLNATSFKKGLSSRSEAGDYSFVLLRKVVDEKAKNIILDGDFITKSANMGAPAQYKVSSIADLNGDGKFEIVVYAHYYEGEWAEVYELNGDTAESVESMKINCGV